MSIYSTDTYQIVSIMNNFITDTDNVTTFDFAILYVQPLPETKYAYIVPSGIPTNYGLVQDDYDVYDRFIANVIPIFETIYYPVITNIIPKNIKSSSNSAISPISMYFNSTAI